MKAVIGALGVVLAFLLVNGNVAFVTKNSYQVVVAADGFGGQTVANCEKVTFYGVGHKTEVIVGASTEDHVGGGTVVRIIHNPIAELAPLAISWGSYPRGNFNTGTWVTSACSYRR